LPEYGWSSSLMAGKMLPAGVKREFNKNNKSDKRGFVPDFVVGLIIAILVFGFAIGFAAKFFQLAEQSKDNFGEFAEKIKLVNQQPDQYSGEAILILDQETAVAYFEPRASEVSMAVYGGLGGVLSVNPRFQKPAQCGDKACLCILRDFSIVEGEVEEVSLLYLDGNRQTFSSRQFKISAANSFCDDSISPNLRMSYCSAGAGKEDTGFLGYTCENGFVIERGVIKEPIAYFYSQAPRRIPIQLTKQENTIFLRS